jgi:Na+/melibiose symporter-like transporter
VSRRGLWRHREFRLYSLSQQTSVAGSSLTSVAVPVIAALDLHASTMQVALLAVAGRLPPLLLSLHAGALVDRVAKRPVLIACELGSALVLLTLPLVSLAATPPLWQLYMVTFTVSALGVVGSTASISWVPHLLERDRLIEANARLGAGNSAADMFGSNTGGALVALLGAARAVTLDCASYIVSALLLLRIHTPEPPPVPRDKAASMLADIRAGLAYTLRTQLVRPLVLANCATSSAMAASSAIWALYLLRNLGWTPTALGVVMGAGGIGGIAGGIAGRRLAARFGPAHVMLTALAINPVAQVPLLLAGPGLAGQVAIGTGMAVQTGCAVAHGGLQRSIRQLLAPAEMQGRAQASGSFLAFGLRPLASLLAGALATAIGLRITLSLITLALTVPFLVLWTSPVRHLHEIPNPNPTAPTRPRPASAALEPSGDHPRNHPALGP